MERTDPAILKLIFAVLNYAEAKDDANNPFVKGFERVQADIDLAYNNMIVALSHCQKYFPEMEEMLDNILSEIAADVSPETPEE